MDGSTWWGCVSTLNKQRSPADEDDSANIVAIEDPTNECMYRIHVLLFAARGSVVSVQQGWIGHQAAPGEGCCCLD